MKRDTNTKTYRWMRIKHPERHFWGVPERMPWPVECEVETDRTAGYQAGDMREGLRRLRAEGDDEWTDEWAALEEFCDRGDELSGMLEKGETEEAIAMLDEMEELRPGTGYCPFNKAFLLRSGKDIEGALACSIEATKRAPGVEWIWMQRAQLHVELNQEAEAITCYRKALGILPKHQQALDGLSKLGALHKLEMVYPDGTIRVAYYTPEDFRKKMAADIANAPLTDPNLRSCVEQMLKYEQGHKADIALLALDRLLSGTPPDVEALRIKKANALRLLKRFEEAHEILDDVTNLGDEPNAEALYVQAWCYFDEKLTRMGWDLIDLALKADRNHQKAIMVKFGVGSKAKPDTVEKLVVWAEENQSWRAYYCAAVQCSTAKNQAGCLKWAEKAYRLAPEERDALFLYANSLNHAEEMEHSAALVHPRLPKCKGDYALKFIFAGAMEKLGLREEAIRVLREALDEGRVEMQSDMKEECERALAQYTGMLATSEIDPEFFPNTMALRREIWTATDAGPQQMIFGTGKAAPFSIEIRMEPPPGYTGSTGSLGFMLHGGNSELEPVNFGWFRTHEIDYTVAERPRFILRVSRHGKLEGMAIQSNRSLPVTWSLYRVPSVETENLP
jgi:tetratricopeptide (TPR) repeat protein